MTSYQPVPQNIAPPPGWYRDPSGPGERWWTGMQWSEHARQSGAESGDLGLLVPKPSTYPTRAIVWGVIGILLPIAVLPGVLAIVFGAIGMSREAALERQGYPSKKATALVGMILGICALALVVGIFVLLPILFPRPYSS